MTVADVISTGVVCSLVFLVASAAVLAFGYSARIVYVWWKERSEFLKYSQVLSIIGSPTYQWDTVKQAVLEAGFPEFCSARSKGEPEIAALTLAMAAIHRELARRSAWWRVYTLKCPELPDVSAVIAGIEENIRSLRAQNITMSKGMEQQRHINQALLVELNDIEDIALFLVSERRNTAGDDHLPYYGADLDEVRLRMGRPGRKRTVCVDDLLIDSYQLLRWVEGQRATGIEPPPCFFQLKKLLASIPPRKCA